MNEIPQTILTEGMIVSYQKKVLKDYHNGDTSRCIAEISSMHPSGVLVTDQGQKTESFTMEEFLKMGPFPVGMVVETRGFWGNIKREWVYGKLGVKDK